MEKPVTGMNLRGSVTRKQPINRESAALMAYLAMLNADHWLFVASQTVNDSQHDRNSLGAIRKLVARRLERLQPEAYKLLAARGARDARAKATRWAVAGERR